MSNKGASSAGFSFALNKLVRSAALVSVVLAIVGSTTVSMPRTDRSAAVLYGSSRHFSSSVFRLSSLVCVAWASLLVLLHAKRASRQTPRSIQAIAVGETYDRACHDQSTSWTSRHS